MKKIAVLLATLILLTSFSACSPKPVTSKPDTPSSSDKPSSSLGSSSSPSSSEDGSSSEQTSSKEESKPDEIISPEDGVRPDNPEPPKEAINPVEQQSVHSSHYCFSMLSSIQKLYYEKMYAAINQMDSGWITLGAVGENYKADIAVARAAVAADHPQLFWLSPYYACATTDNGTTAVVWFSASEDSDNPYLFLRSEKAAATSALETAVQEITSRVTATDPYNIELQLHDLLCDRVTYATTTDNPMVYTAYGALVNGSAVCEGYSRAMQLLLERFGILSVLVSGSSLGEGHMWNAVKLADSWYHLDVTWNDSKANLVSYEYFNIPESMILLDHNINKNYPEFAPADLENGQYAFNIATPACQSSKYYYYSNNGFIFSAGSEEGLVDYIAKSGESVIEVAFSDNDFRNLFENESQDRIADISFILLSKYPEFTLRIGGYSISSSVLRLYMQPLE